MVVPFLRGLPRGAVPGLAGSQLWWNGRRSVQLGAQSIVGMVERVQSFLASERLSRAGFADSRDDSMTLSRFPPSARACRASPAARLASQPGMLGWMDFIQPAHHARPLTPPLRFPAAQRASSAGSAAHIHCVSVPPPHGGGTHGGASTC